MPPKRERKVKQGKIDITVKKKNVTKKTDKVIPDNLPEVKYDDLNEEVEDEEILPDLDPMDDSKIQDKFLPQTIKEIVILSPENRITSDHLTLMECTEILSIRAEQIRRDGVTFIDDDNISDYIEIARRELILKRCPLSVRRAITDNVFEVIPVNDMIINPNITYLKK